MDEKLLNSLGLRSLDEETLTLLRYGLTEIDGNEGAKILGITPNSFRVRASRIRHRKGTLSLYKKKTGPKTRYKVEGYAEIIKSYRKKNLSESEISYILKETIGVGVSPATIGRFLKEEGFERMHRRSLKKKRKAIETVKEIVLDYKNKHRRDVDQLGEHICRSSNAGVFLFAPLIENDNILNIVSPIPERAKAKRYFLTLLALKLIEKKRISAFL
jgi:transposase